MYTNYCYNNVMCTYLPTHAHIGYNICCRLVCTPSRLSSVLYTLYGYDHTKISGCVYVYVYGYGYGYVNGMAWHGMAWHTIPYHTIHTIPYHTSKY